MKRGQLDLESKIIYDYISSGGNPNGIEGIMTLKLTFNSLSDFSQAVNNWEGTPAEQKWLADQVYARDNKLDKTKPINLTYIRYKDSVLNGNPVVVIVVKYNQLIKGEIK